MGKTYIFFVFVIIFSFFNIQDNYAQVIMTSNGSCASDLVGYFTSSSCWDRTGTCPDAVVAIERPIVVPADPELEAGDIVVIGEEWVVVLDSLFNPIIEGEDTLKVLVEDYIITAEGVRLETVVGDEVIVQAGYTVYYADGRIVVAQAPYVPPAPVYELQGTSSCPVEFIINHDISPGNIHIKDHVTIKVGSGVNLDLNNLSIDKAATVNIIVDGGDVTMNSLVVDAATINKNNSKKTELNIDLINSGSFTVNGLTDLKNNTTLTIDGDGSGKVVTTDIAINQNVTVNVEEGGGLQVLGATRINGNSSGFNIKGDFETESLTVAGGQNSYFNAIGSANVIIKEDVEIFGNTTKVTFGGDSEISVGGDFEVRGGSTVVFDDNSKTLIEGSVYVRGTSEMYVTGNAEMDIVGGCVDFQTDCEGGIFLIGGGTLDVTETAEVYVCGIRPEANADEGVDVNLYCEDAEDGEPCAIYTGCRVLPVNFIDVTVEHERTERYNILSWSTSKEWENSHFEVERSTDGTKSFEKIGQVAGRGWTDEVTEYNFEDDKLPLTGGNIFYRLKQVDFNGKYEYSDITAVRVPNVHFTKGVWRAYPNPTVGSEFNLELVDIAQYHDEAISLRILSSHISSEEMKFRNLQELNQSASDIMAKAPTGLWIFELQWGNKVERIKVMRK
ncbi:MAG TPA: hypothetical protein VK921_14305 [Anditalea sp.]|nr:hypothetical protein [Anditalea sp.]